MSDKQLRRLAAWVGVLCIAMILAALAYRAVAFHEFNPNSAFILVICLGFLLIFPWRVLGKGEPR